MALLLRPQLPTEFNLSMRIRRSFVPLGRFHWSTKDGFWGSIPVHMIPKLSLGRYQRNAGLFVLIFILFFNSVWLLRCIHVVFICR